MTYDELQVENGNFTRIINPVIDELVKAPFKGCELAMAIFIIRKTWGYNKTQDEISLSQIMLGIGRSKPTITKTLKSLQDYKIIKLVKAGGCNHKSGVWKINKYIDTWQLVKGGLLVKCRGSTGKGGLPRTGKGGFTHKRHKDNTKDIKGEITKNMKYQPINDEGQEVRKVAGLKHPVSSRGEFNQDREMTNMVKLSKPYKIVAHYFLAKKFRFENQDQWYAELARNLRVAKLLKGYSKEQVQLAIDYCQKNYEVWTLETLTKRIADIINAQ